VRTTLESMTDTLVRSLSLTVVSFTLQAPSLLQSYLEMDSSSAHISQSSRRMSYCATVRMFPKASGLTPMHGQVRAFSRDYTCKPGLQREEQGNALYQ
jgi:hypothetical protein